MNIFDNSPEMYPCPHFQILKYCTDPEFQPHAVTLVLLFAHCTVLELSKKQLGGSSAVGDQEVESRHARCMWDREGTLLDPSVGGGSVLSSKILDFLF